MDTEEGRLCVNLFSYFLLQDDLSSDDERKPTMLTSEIGKTATYTTVPRRVKSDVRSASDMIKTVKAGKYFCEICQKGFNYDKRDHLLKHEGTLLKCKFCPKTFETHRGLEKHLPKHTGEHPHPCPHCDAGFPLKNRLEAHIKRKHPSIHNYNQGKGYACLNCSGIFYTESDLVRHQRICRATF